MLRRNQQRRLRSSQRNRRKTKNGVSGSKWKTESKEKVLDRSITTCQMLLQAGQDGQLYIKLNKTEDMCKEGWEGGSRGSRYMYTWS